MNPYIQAKKNDPDLEYIHEYIPEIRDADKKQILSQSRDKAILNEDGEILYPAPVVDYDESRKEYAAWARRYLVPYRPTKGSSR